MSQSGFLQKHSCQTALVKLIDQWMACVDKGDILGSLSVDFRKAFDVVDISVLLRKLLCYKFSANATKCLFSAIDNKLSTLEKAFLILCKYCQETRKALYLELRYFYYLLMIYLSL